MNLHQLRLFNFKNYLETSVTLEGKTHCFLGNNGSGKTNLLDAIHYLSFTKSAFLSSDQHSIHNGESFFTIQGEFLVKEKLHTVSCGYALGKKKTMTENGEECSRMADHIGKFPVVMISPQDIELIWNGSELRRKFIDGLLCQIDKQYLDHLITYSNQLKQRNSYLKISAGSTPDSTLLEGYHQALSTSGAFIYQKRKRFLSDFLHQTKNYYELLSDQKETIDILYRSDQHQMGLAESLRLNLEKDRILQRTTIGIHRDDFVFMLGSAEFRKQGSQGQQKSFLIALKLAAFQVLAKQKQLMPLLLMDDIFDKLDDIRIQKLMTLVSGDDFGQLFITDARPRRCREIVGQGSLDAKFYLVKNGSISHE